MNTGSIGVYATKNGNNIVQKCDLLIVLGARLNPTITSGKTELFSPMSKKIKVDIDFAEFGKENGIKYDLKIKSDLKIDDDKYMRIINNVWGLH